MTRYKIIGYRDLRPVDWLSGKRLPLEPGEGHICDRCGAEHAVVYTVLDTELQKQFNVGSGCAKQQFGFEAERQSETKAFVKSEKEKVARELDDVRQAMVARAAEEIVRELSKRSLPEPAADVTTYKGTVAWRVGDGVALAAPGRSEAETLKVARQDFYERRIREMVPHEWEGVSLRLYPDQRSKTDILMSRKVAMLVMGLLRDLRVVG